MRPLLACLLLLAACGDSDRDDDAPVCEPSVGTTASGVFRVGARAEADGRWTYVEGLMVGGTGWQFFNMAPQRAILVAADGDCQLFESDSSLCDPACDDGICYHGTCWPYPELLSAGTVRAVAGGALFQMEADAPSFWGPVYQESIRLPLGERDAISMCAAGGEAGGFAAELTAVAPLAGAAPEDGVLELEDGADNLVRWEAEPDSESRVRLTLNADNTGHGLAYPAVIVCDAEDTGQLVIPQAMIEAFPPVPRPPDNFACAGTDCPRSQLIRYRAVTIDEPDLQVEVRAESAVEFWIAH